MEIRRVPVSVYAEMTPNPSVMKFVSNKLLTDTDSIEFKNIEEAQDIPMVANLFHFPFIKEVFISGNYMAVTKFNIVEWEDVALEIREYVANYLQENEGLVLTEKDVELKKEESTTKGEKSDQPKIPNLEDLGEVETRIVDILEEYVKPAVQSDGGNIAFISYKDKTVNVLLQGACSGCPSSTATLKQGIQNILQQMLPTLVDDVVAVNG